MSSSEVDQTTFCIGFVNRVEILRTGQTTSYGERDDGALQKAFPKWTRYNFADNFFQGQHFFQSGYIPGNQGILPPTAETFDGTMADTLTNLAWLNHATCYGKKTWYEAIEPANTTMDGQTQYPLYQERGYFLLVRDGEI